MNYPAIAWRRPQHEVETSAFLWNKDIWSQWTFYLSIFPRVMSLKHYYYYYLFIFFYRKLHAVYITIDGCHYVWHKAQTATLHETRGPAECPTLKPDTGMLTHLPLGDSGPRLQRHSLPRTSMFRRISLLVSWAWVSQCRSWTPLLNERRTRTTPTTPDVRCISPWFQSANTPAMSKNQRQPATTVQAILYKP